MNILNYKLYYFLGVGGIGMSALARYFHHYNKPVYGYDKTRTTLCAELEEEGIHIHYDEQEAFIKELFAEYDKEDILVIYTPAVPTEHTELMYIRRNGYHLQK